MGIPKQIFQICIGFNSVKNYLLVDKINRFSQLNPDYEFNLIASFNELDDFVQNHCPETIKRVYFQIKELDSKVEFCKYAILYEYGGIFIDASLDFSLFNLDTLLLKKDEALIVKSSIPNTYHTEVMAFIPGHSILEKMIKLMIKYIKTDMFSENSGYTIESPIQKNAGSDLFSKAIKITHFLTYNKNIEWSSIEVDQVFNFTNRDMKYRLFGSWTALLESANTVE
jgi:mannosyltransferase OCH1-like enzyme